MNVVWLSYTDAPNRGYWDQGLLELLLADGDVHDTLDGLDGAVVVLPGRFHHGHLDRLNADLARLSWVLLIVTSDEESLFPWPQVRHDNMRLWIMTPRPDRHISFTGRVLGEGYAANTPAVLTRCDAEHAGKPVDVFFAGQVTHDRRHACLAATDALTDRMTVVTAPTESFAAGMPRDDYLRMLAASKLAPCPSGPATPDSFRVYEALEAHTLPIADGRCAIPTYPDGYWHQFNPPPPFPVVTDWADLGKEVDAALAEWPHNVNQAVAWWMDHKRNLRLWLADDVAALTGTVSDTAGVTVLIPTSPIPSHPSTDVIEPTVASVREQLPDAEIVLMVDGIRAEQTDRTPDFGEYTRRLLWLADHQWGNCLPLIAPRHMHQANLTRWALDHVRTDQVLFVEHDTPICGPIDWPAVSAALRSGQANLVRFHHEAHVLDVHRHLMLDDTPQRIEGAPLLRTVQWSQRPHLASTGFYRSLLAAHFPATCSTMIEDVMHGVLHNAYIEHGEAGWQQYRTWMYAPDGDMKRSLHLDGRGDDPKFSMRFT